MPPPLLVALCIAAAYALLIAAHTARIRRGRVPGAYEPRVALWLATRLTSGERRATAQLLRGELDPERYRAAMAEAAARDAAP